MDWLPGATRKPMHESGFDWQLHCPTKVICHTTEGSNSVPNYPSQYEPHLTVVPIPGKGVKVYQHIAFSKAAYALKHPQGTVPTNGAHAIQIELAGSCDPDTHSAARRAGGYFWPHADDAVLLDLYRKVIAPLAEAFGVHLTSPEFKPYPASYGLHNGVRFTPDQWINYGGFAGHQHVPSQDHGDPGAFPFARMVHLGKTAPKRGAKAKKIVPVVAVIGAGVVIAGNVHHHPGPVVGPAPKKSVPVTVVPTKPSGPTTVRRPAKRAAPAPTIHGVLSYGSTGASVRELQRKLGIKADGNFGRITLRHVLAVQKHAHLTQDGKVGRKTAHALGLGFANR
jgi:hypothetical protein